MSDNPLSRRVFLRAIAVSGAGVAPGCATARPCPEWPRARVSPGREIRTDVGLRPFRPAGFVVRAEKLAEKIIVHNYGHGGGGVTLSWGTADLASRLALETGALRAAVLGCGAVGLATARLLQLRGAAVRVYAAALPPDTTSNVAGAQVFPFSVCDRNALVPPFREQFAHAAAFSYRWFQGLIGERFGVRWMTNYLLSGDPPREDEMTGRHGPIAGLLPDLDDVPPDEHPFPTRYVRRFATMMVEPDTYLRELMREVRLAGAEIVVRRFASVEELATLPEPVVVNCTGLGAGALFGDRELMPVKGQLTVLLPQPELNYVVLAGEFYMFPRRDGVLLGGTFERGVATLEPDLEAKKHILAGHAQLFRPQAPCLRPQTSGYGS